jgi:hypothetical protein
MRRVETVNWISKRQTDLRQSLSVVTPQTILVLLVFILSILLVSSNILPSYTVINQFDAAKYIESGRQLIDGGELRELSRSPTLALMYGAIYLFVRNSLNWFVLSAGIGNLLLYAFLWLGTYYLGLRFRACFHPATLLGVLFVSPALFIILGNPSDALYAGFSMIALARTIDFSRTLHLRDLASASIFIGLAFVTRPDGLYLFPLFVVLTFIIGFRIAEWYRLISANLVPALAVIGVFFIASGLSRGEFSTGFGSKAYNSLQWYGTTDTSGTLIDGQKVIEIFGTADDNKGSALLAFSRNPSAVVNKIIDNLKQAPAQILSDYGGKKFSPFFLLFCFAGLISLIQGRSYTLLAFFLLWPLDAGLYLLFYTRSGQYLHSLFILYVTFAIGLQYVFSSDRTRVERAGILVIVIGILIYSLVDQKPAFTAVAVLSLAVLLLFWLSLRREFRLERPNVIGLFLVFSAALILRPPFSFPQPWIIGESPAEQAVHFLEEKLEPGDVVGTSAPKPVVAAKMKETWLVGISIEADPVDSVRTWIETTHVKALIIEPSFVNSYPDIWSAIQQSVGTLLEPPRIFDPGSIQIFLVTDRSSSQVPDKTSMTSSFQIE